MRMRMHRTRRDLYRYPAEDLSVISQSGRDPCWESINELNLFRGDDVLSMSTLHSRPRIVSSTSRSVCHFFAAVTVNDDIHVQ